MTKILICDDERDIVNALKIYLNDPGYELYEAYDGRQALKIVETEDIDLILLDIMMPVMDGISTLSEIRKNYNMPIILLTAKSELMITSLSHSIRWKSLPESIRSSEDI